MSAEVVNLGGRVYQAWCNECSDGVNEGVRVKAEGWADRHNAARHGQPTPAVDREQWIPGR